MERGLLFVTCILLFVGCVAPPTKIYESKDLDIKKLVSASKRPLVIDKSTVVIDARSAFNYSLAHIPQSQNIQWQDFSNPKATNKGMLSNDLYKEARRLARKGVDPETPVIVVGDGKGGQGEEGRVAWTLLHLGIKNVQFASIDYFRNNLSHREAPPIKNKSVWKPDLVNSVVAKRAEVEAAAGMTASKPKQKTYVIDVRSSQEFLRGKSPNIDAINIDWKEFITDKGRPNWQIRKKLEDYGVSPSHRIILLSNRGVRSAAATAALLTLGFGNSANFMGGYEALSR